MSVYQETDLMAKGEVGCSTKVKSQGIARIELFQSTLFPCRQMGVLFEETELHENIYVDS